MAYSLRLPPALDADARARCERLGISLNALLCVALDAYLRGATPAAQTPDSPGQAGPEPADSYTDLVELAPAKAPAPAVRSGPEKLTKAQRREITRLERLARKG